jgi:hypothetical protein
MTNPTAPDAIITMGGPPVRRVAQAESLHCGMVALAGCQGVTVRGSVNVRWNTNAGYVTHSGDGSRAAL